MNHSLEERTKGETRRPKKSLQTYVLVEIVAFWMSVAVIFFVVAAAVMVDKTVFGVWIHVQNDPAMEGAADRIESKIASALEGVSLDVVGTTLVVDVTILLEDITVVVVSSFDEEIVVVDRVVLAELTVEVAENLDELLEEGTPNVVLEFVNAGKFLLRYWGTEVDVSCCPAIVAGIVAVIKTVTVVL